ncbi:ATP-binding cassette domain-containing protein [Methylobacterium sp. E-005]|uniref:ATP-binding cassette domain-containing protein n=1 Tax=Methylobacterium sp. E-005 TaxID=2836549 RepID=UPI001FBAAEF2|nr:ATP-binding cassette domain-containing protein [Methylobacterium sp. E-005]MCJ2088806.1 ATP-binding cassette domain-containing protein [Methylobacterium sp. E-005]
MPEIVRAGAAIVLGNAAAASDGRPVLPGITLTVRAGERIALMGRSGAGESTLIGLFHGQAPDRMALVPQAARVRPPPVFHNVHMGRRDRRSPLYNLRRRIRPARADIAAVEAVLDRVGLANRLRAKAGELSGGQRQRVSVARALYNGRPVLVGDEAGLRARPPAGRPDPHRAGPQP